MNRQLLKTISPITLLCRAKGYKPSGGVRYPGGIQYFPRHPDHKDPEITPSKLFRVEQIRTSRHHPWWQKKILSELKLDEENRVAIVKNIPPINMRLWKIKHLIRVTPITFPYGEPMKEDINYTVLKENGQCIVTKTLQPEQKQVEALEKFETDPKKMDSTTLKRESRYRWNDPFAGGF
ncbi:39S ribosomal protein L30, mitochondrial [Bicyclus anynana]|uniref:Large ribosomal subunit protein uL30m n=1 Tax=Bicyclus anynana TaxID=110368 RepID=A0A6J1N9P3_BICAN|nr:39S ribosomal protein L30, mitochondrial [Bicyclus anynana]